MAFPFRVANCKTFRIRDKISETVLEESPFSFNPPETRGWIKLDPDKNIAEVTQADIVENPHNLEFVELTSTNIPTTLSDFSYAVVTGSIVYNAGIDPSTALLNEDILDHLILQVVVKEENKDAKWAQAIVDAYHSDEFKQYLDENNDGLWYVPDSLFE